MKRRTLLGLVALAFAILFGMIGDAADALYLLSGLLFLLAIGLFASHAKFWGRFKLPKLAPLFPKVREWDSARGGPK
ncbi:MAG: hypothetical protein ACPHK8_00515 [Thermoplasmatota archaeon]